MQNNLISNNQVTMSSREIAVFCEKRHDHVCRDIIRMFNSLKKYGLDKGPGGAPKFGVTDFETEYVDSQGKTHKGYVLSKKLTLNLITKYRDDIRYRIIERFEELEGNQPQLANEVARLQREVDQLKANNRTIEIENSHTVFRELRHMIRYMMDDDPDLGIVASFISYYCNHGKLTKNQLTRYRNTLRVRKTPLLPAN